MNVQSRKGKPVSDKIKIESIVKKAPVPIYLSLFDYMKMKSKNIPVTGYGIIFVVQVPNYVVKREVFFICSIGGASIV